MECGRTDLVGSCLLRGALLEHWCTPCLPGIMCTHMEATPGPWRAQASDLGSDVMGPVLPVCIVEDTTPSNARHIAMWNPEITRTVVELLSTLRCTEACRPGEPCIPSCPVARRNVMLTRLRDDGARK